MERAAARKFAKESMELIEDERLELMELAASSKGLPSILSLDYNTLQNLELFRGRCSWHSSAGLFFSCLILFIIIEHILFTILNYLMPSLYMQIFLL